MTDDASHRAPRGVEQDLVGALLERLGSAFDLDHDAGGRALGDRIEERLRRIREREARGETPTWGTVGDPTEVSSEESRGLRFLYHPHLFPGMEPKLRLAHELQFDLLPTRLPAGFPLSVSAVLESYCHLSGDLLGWRTTPRGSGLLWVVDVSGHGVRSGLASAVIKILLDQAPAELGPADLLGWLDRAFRASRRSDDPRPLYATGIFLEVDGAGTGRVASAGHHPALLRREEGEILELESTAPPLALLEEARFREAAVSLYPDDVLLLYTDGVVDAQGRNGEAFGGDRLAGFLRGARSGLTDLTSTIHRAVSEHTRDRGLDDDLTFLAAGRSAGPA